MHAPVYLIPGLGADSRTFEGPWFGLPGCIRPDWPGYQGEASIAAVARFVADAWKIPQDAVLVGTSFGGMIACEIAKFTSVKTLVLVASSDSAKDFATTSRMMLLTHLIPLRPVQWALKCLAFTPKLLGNPRLSPHSQALLTSIRMFTDCQPSFYRDMFKAMFMWDGLAGSTTEVIRIHGRNDHVVVPPPKVDLSLDGGHLIAMTHARQCVDYLQTRLFPSVS
ncbi:alpha/beta hydrolase [Prosthecobacter sp.]|uniref:alpha/beta hydrolase n=1 Tax=Prosthecobacter sp. TaxID=1965333 RepID=UPI001DE69BD5|nr:alpha/beta hydrolase [Prosthecobacter sp.]MCB1277641.1 alpha/beta hydrolase [Prosthecobacter sp.]